MNLPIFRKRDRRGEEKEEKEEKEEDGDEDTTSTKRQKRMSVSRTATIPSIPSQKRSHTDTIPGPVVASVVAPTPGSTLLSLTTTTTSSIPPRKRVRLAQQTHHFPSSHKIHIVKRRSDLLLELEARIQLRIQRELEALQKERMYGEERLKELPPSKRWLWQERKWIESHVQDIDRRIEELRSGGREDRRIRAQMNMYFMRICNLLQETTEIVWNGPNGIRSSMGSAPVTPFVPSDTTLDLVPAPAPAPVPVPVVAPAPAPMHVQQQVISLVDELDALTKQAAAPTWNTSISSSVSHEFLSHPVSSMYPSTRHGSVQEPVRSSSLSSSPSPPTSVPLVMTYQTKVGSGKTQHHIVSSAESSTLTSSSSSFKPGVVTYSSTSSSSSSSLPSNLQGRTWSSSSTSENKIIPSQWEDAPVYMMQTEYCDTCHIPMKIIGSEAVRVCPLCTKTVKNQEAATLNRPMDTGGSSDRSNAHSSTQVAKQQTYVNDWLNKVQVKNQKLIPEAEIFKIIDFIYHRYRLLFPEDIVDEHINRAMREIKTKNERGKEVTMKSILGKYTVQIRCRIKGLPIPFIPSDVEQQLRDMFKAIVAPYQYIIEQYNATMPNEKEKRKNGMSFPYSMNRFCHLLGKDEYEMLFPVLRGIPKRAWYEARFEGICRLLDWEFIPCEPVEEEEQSVPKKKKLMGPMTVFMREHKDALATILPPRK